MYQTLDAKQGKENYTAPNLNPDTSLRSCSWVNSYSDKASGP